MRPIRASEIGAFLFCKRAWWYQSQGIENQNQKELAAGTAFHAEHGRKVLAAGLLRLAGGVVLALGLITLVVLLTLQWLK
jgi:CRISPR/Cas system-associated exonuclease Cas4 (RecB family)